MSVIRRNCPHCFIEKVAFEIVASFSLGPATGNWNCLANCGACLKPICFAARDRYSTGAIPTQLKGDLEDRFYIAEIWPSPEEFSAPLHTPTSVAKRFLEGEDAFSRRNWNSAVAMYRSALDIATKGMDGVPAGTFYSRLQWLHDNHKITPDIWQWATHVRVEGNAALHDPDEFDEKDAKALRFFTEMFLRYVFELPGEVREFRTGLEEAASE